MTRVNLCNMAFDITADIENNFRQPLFSRDEKIRFIPVKETALGQNSRSFFLRYFRLFFVCGDGIVHAKIL